MFILLFPFNSIAQDALLQAIYGNWYNPNKYENEDKAESVESYDESEAEIYHWELGTPDNIPEIEIIYEDSPCNL